MRKHAQNWISYSNGSGCNQPKTRENFTIKRVTEARCRTVLFSIHNMCELPQAAQNRRIKQDKITLAS